MPRGPISAPAFRPDIVIIGSTTDAQLPDAIEALGRNREIIAGWLADSVPLLAVGTGWELLSESIELSAGTIAGLGLLPGRAALAATRVTDDLVVDSRFGRLIGYENHARDYIVDGLTGADTLGRVTYGRGNGGAASSAAVSSALAGFEGLVIGSTIATHLHGPVLAKNPTVADHLLGLALGDVYDSRSVPAGRVDDIARAARNVIATRLELGAE